jgi:hypothetical protein
MKAFVLLLLLLPLPLMAYAQGGGELRVNLKVSEGSLVGDSLSDVQVEVMDELGRPVGNAQVNADFTIHSVDGSSRSKGRVELRSREVLAGVPFYEIRESDPDFYTLGEDDAYFELELKASDNAGNRGRRSILRAVRGGEDSLFRINHLYPDSDNFAYGQTVDFRLHVWANPNQEGTLRNKNVFVFVDGRRCDSCPSVWVNDSLYSMTYRLPLSEDEKRELNLEFYILTGFEFGETYQFYGYGKSKPVRLSSILLVKEMNSTVDSLIFSLSYPDGAPVENADATIFTEDGEEVKGLSVEGSGGRFVVGFSQPRPLGEKLSLQVTDESGNSVQTTVFAGGRITTIEERGIDLGMLLTLIVMAAVVTLATYLGLRRYRERSRLQEKYSKLKEEEKRVKGLIKRVKYEFYKRHISEKELQKKVEDYQKQLKEANNELEKLGERVEKETTRKDLLREAREVGKLINQGMSHQDVVRYLQGRGYSSAQVEVIIKYAREMDTFAQVRMQTYKEEKVVRSEKELLEDTARLKELQKQGATRGQILEYLKKRGYTETQVKRIMKYL